MSGGSSLPKYLLFLSFLVLANAEPVILPYNDCFDVSKGLENKFTVDTVYGQVLNDQEHGTSLNLTVIGSSPLEIVGTTTASNSLATLFTTTSILTLNVWTNSSYLCDSLRPPSPLPALVPQNSTYCPIPAGPFTFSSRIPWGDNRELTTLTTRLRAVDPFGLELVCIDVTTTPLDPEASTIYGNANIILWSTAALALAYWAVVGIARVSSAWNRGISRSGKGLWAKAQSAGFILASAVSGERLANSPALLRFCTPSMRDVFFHTQWCALLGMVAVEWPQFAYPLLTQTAWSTLSYNVSMTRESVGKRFNPLYAPPFDPPAAFADQLRDTQSPIFIDATIPNRLYSLPSGASHGITSFAYTLGIRPQDLFPTCIVLFGAIAAGLILVSGVFWFLDVFVTSILRKFTGSTPAYGGTTRSLKTPTYTKEVESPLVSAEEERPRGLGFALPTSALSASPSGDRGYHRSWWCFKFRSDIGSFHGNVLHGNLVRILILFHLPLTVFSCYHMILPRSVVPGYSIFLAALSFTVLSILLPAYLVIRVTLLTTNKLYDDMRTLLSLGPLYNHYRHGSQLFAGLLFITNIAFGVTIGAGQKSGTAQAIVILVVEVISALVTSIWLPWGTGASMGLISFLFCVARIVVAVLLVILSPTISVGAGPGGWVAYGILIVLALVYLALVLLLVVKIFEAIVRILGGVGFDRSRHVTDSGLVGACGLLGCCGSRKRRRNNKGKQSAGGGGGRSGDSKSKSSGMGDSPSSVQLGSTLLKERRASDLSSYNPPAALHHGDVSDLESINGPRFMGGVESRKGSTNSQPPSVLRPEHANQPYREDTDREWWNENEGQGGAFIMGAWQPFGSNGKPTGQPGGFGGGNASPTTGAAAYASNSAKSTKASPQAATPSSGFSRVGGGRAHIDSPYAITATGNSHSQVGIQNPSGSTHAFPTVGPIVPASGASSLVASPAGTPIQQQQYSSHQHPAGTSAGTSYPPSSFNRHQPQSYTVDEDEPAIPVSSVRQAHSTPMQHSDINALPPGAMQPAHIRTKSQTAIIEDAGTSLYGSGGNNNGGSAAQPGSSISARFSLSNIKIPIYNSGGGGGGGLNPPSANYIPTSAPPMFTLNPEDDERDDDESVDQQQKKKWYQLRKKRPHSSEGRTTTSGTPITRSSSSVPLGPDMEFGGRQHGSEGDASAPGSVSQTPQRSFVVVRKPMGSMGRLNQATAAAAAASGSASASSSGGAGQRVVSPRSRPPTR